MIDLNADLGEGAGTDGDLLPYITSASVACGVHAGDLATIRRTVEFAQARGVGIGAHPSFPDRDGFGRRSMTLSAEEVVATVAAQIEVVARVARDVGTHLQHVKPHGSLYNQSATDHALAASIGAAVHRVDASLIVMALAGSPSVTVLLNLGLRVAQEAFIDRGYSSGGMLVPRDRPGAIITDPAAAAQRAVQLAVEHAVSTETGETIRVEADTLCIHGDTPRAAVLARAVRQALEHAGVGVKRLDAFL